MLSLFSREEQEALQHKLVAIEKKIIVGGENLLEKAEEQERLLEESAKELKLTDILSKSSISFISY